MPTTQRVSRFMLEPTDSLPTTTETHVNSWDTVGQPANNNRDTRQQLGHCGTARQQQQRHMSTIGMSTAGTLWDSPTATTETNVNSWDIVGQSDSNNRDRRQQLGHCGTVRQQQQRQTSTAETLWDSPPATTETDVNSWDSVGQSSSNNRDKRQQLGHCGTACQQQYTAVNSWDTVGQLDIDTDTSS